MLFVSSINFQFLSFLLLFPLLLSASQLQLKLQMIRNGVEVVGSLVAARRLVCDSQFNWGVIITIYIGSVLLDHN